MKEGTAMVIHAAVAAAALRRALQRVCPQCHHRMTVPLAKKNETVACEKCDTPVPPNPTKS